jgi:hypothetical protein
MLFINHQSREYIDTFFETSVYSQNATNTTTKDLYRKIFQIKLRVLMTNGHLDARTHIVAKRDKTEVVEL